jgi:hypothetical protein
VLKGDAPLKGLLAYDLDGGGNYDCDEMCTVSERLSPNDANCCRLRKSELPDPEPGEAARGELFDRRRDARRGLVPEIADDGSSIEVHECLVDHSEVPISRLDGEDRKTDAMGPRRCEEHHPIDAFQGSGEENKQRTLLLKKTTLKSAESGTPLKRQNEG